MQADVQELKHIKAEPIPVSGSELKTKAVKKQGLSQFQRMQTVNKDIKGWLTIPGTNIDYPVLQSSKDEPDYYLHRNYKKQYAEAGSIHLQYETTSITQYCDLRSPNEKMIWQCELYSAVSRFAETMRVPSVQQI